jgi:hypothetical protein
MFPDPQLAVRNLLRRILADRSEPYAEGATVSTKPIEEYDEAPGRPYIQVRSDGRFRNSRLNGRATVRVLVYHDDEGLGEKLAALCEALLLAASSPEIRGVAPLVGPLPIGGGADGDPLSYFTITARLRPIQLSP